MYRVQWLVPHLHLKLASPSLTQQLLLVKTVALLGLNQQLVHGGGGSGGQSLLLSGDPQQDVGLPSLEILTAVSKVALVLVMLYMYHFCPAKYQPNKDLCTVFALIYNQSSILKTAFVQLKCC